MNALQRLGARMLGLPIPTEGQKAAGPRQANRTVTAGPLSPGPYAYRMVAGSVQLYDRKTDQLISESYLKNSGLYSVVNFILRKAKRAPFYLCEVKDEKSLRRYKNLMNSEGNTLAGIHSAQLVRTKALEEVTGDHPIKRILERPNPDQSWSEFLEQALAYKLLTGERFLQRVAGLNPVTHIYALPPTLMRVWAGPAYMSYEKFTYMPSQADLKPDEVVFSKKFYPALYGYGDELRGLSPLQVLALSIQESNEGALSAIRQFQHGGPPGVLFDDSENHQQALTAEQAQELKDMFNRDNAGSNNRGKVHVTNQRLGWLTTGLSPVDLNILESRQFTLRDFCNVYNLDANLFNDKTASTYNNVKEAKTAGIVDAVVPELLDLRDDLNRLICEPFNAREGKRYFIECDVTEFPEMQQDQKTMIDSLTKVWSLPPNKLLEALKFDTIPDPLMDEPWVPAGVTPLSEYKAIPKDEQDAPDPDPAAYGDPKE